MVKKLFYVIFTLENYIDLMNIERFLKDYMINLFYHKPDIIYIGGDVVHGKLDTSPEETRMVPFLSPPPIHQQ